ncbi:MAG: hypothetical protein IJN80_05515, partial [Clostridia bacterium]|nr:hypothetical protein [Clostridia bacterium]
MFTKKTRVISAIATVCMLISMLACIAVPAHAVETDPGTYPSVQAVTSLGTCTETDYTVASVDDWLYLYEKQNLFTNTNITIHIIADLDLAGLAASAFTSVTPYNRTSFTNPAFSLDGHGHTIKNWGTKNARMATAGLIRIENPSADCLKSIKNLTFENCHTTGSGGANTALIFTTWGGDAGYDYMASEFTMENVHVKNCSVNGEANRNAIFMSNYAKKNGAYTVNMKNCS